MRIKVKREVLVKKVEEHLATLLQENKEADKVRLKAHQQARKQAITNLRELADRLEAETGEMALDSYGEITVRSNKATVSIMVELPDIEEHATWKTERDLEALKAGSDENISLGPDDSYYRYFSQPEKYR